MRKCLAVFFAVLLLSAALTVHAASANETISLGQTKVTTVQPGEVADYHFTPSVSGSYALCMEETGANLQNWICLDADTEVPERYYRVAGWEGKVFSLEAGKSYTFRVTCASGIGAGMARALRLERVSTTSALTIDAPQSTGYVGEVLWFRPGVSNPGAVNGSFQWSSSNPSVARIENTENIEAAVMPVSPGTATITVSVGGLSTSYVLTVNAPKNIPVGGSIDLTLQPYTGAVFTVTPNESGRYAIWNRYREIGISVDGNYNSQLFSGAEDSNGYIYDLRAGVTYKCYVAGPPTELGTVTETFHFDKVRPVQSLSLKGDNEIYPVGVSMLLCAVTDPVCGVIEGVNWSCSDPDVLKLEPNGSTSAYCQATVLKPGRATVTVTVGSLSASWEYGVPDAPQWQLGTSATVPILHDQFSTYAFIPDQDGYYRFTVTADRDTFFTVTNNNDIYGPLLWAGRHITAGQSAAIEVYLHKGVPYSIDVSGSGSGGGTLVGRVERMGTADKEVSHIAVNASPAAYEYGNDDYGMMLDGVYHFHPLGYQGMEGLSFTVFYADGSSALVSASELFWDEYTGMGATACTWNGYPVEITLLADGIAPSDVAHLYGPGTVMARLRYMGVSVDFPLTVTPGHAHQLTFTEKTEPTQEQSGVEAHYVCEGCGKLYWNAEGTDRIMNPEDIVLSPLPADGTFVADGNELQNNLQQLQPGDIYDLPVPDEDTSVVLPADTLAVFVQQENTLLIPTKEATASFDPAALAAIASQAAGKQVTLQMLRVEPDALNEQQQAALQEYEAVHIISANMLCGDTYLHDFGSGSVTVRIPFEADPDGIYAVIYIARDGTVETVPSQRLDGSIEFTTGHFSEYSIVRTGTQFPQALLWIILGVALLIGIGAALLFLKKRSASRKGE